MYNNKTVKTIKPLIFTKKLNDNVKTIFLNETENTLGYVRYFPPANQEWLNSIYAYNSTYIKNITVVDKNLSRLIKSYFNLHFNKKLLYNKRILARFRRLAINRIFVNKAELKHTNSRVIVTLYVYNEEKRVLLNRIRRLENILFPSIGFVSDSVYENKILSLYKKLYIIKKQRFSFLNWLEEIKKYMVEEMNLEIKILETINKLELRSKKLLVIKALEENIRNILIIIVACKNDSAFLKSCENTYGIFSNKSILEKEIFIITYLKLLLSLNKSKFEDKFVLKLSSILSKIYNKKVEFNIINLKTVYLNSDIFTQAISLQLRNRNNQLLRVLRYFLYMVKLPKINALKERFDHISVKNLWINRVKNLTLKSLDFSVTRDSINRLLISLFSDSNFLKESVGKEAYISNNRVEFNRSNDLLNRVFNNLKHKNIGGVRLEVKGRLTKRFTASRSVFKIKWKGGLKNIDSSYKGLSSMMLRGYVKPNMQYSIVNSKTRNGAFGLKGWISSK